MEAAAATTKTEEPKTYDEKVIECFKHLSSLNPAGASPTEVRDEMLKRGWLSPMDTVIDIVKIMRRLRHEEGRL